MPGLPLALAIHIHEVSAAVVVVVGLIAAGLAVTGYRASVRSGNRNLVFVSAAFAVFAGKGLFTGWAVWTRTVPHEHLELILSLADLAVILLLVVPLVKRARRTGT